MTTTRPATKSLARRRTELANLYRELSGYNAMLQVAKLYGLSPEVDRLARTILEWEAEIDDAIESAADAGYGPEDFECLNDEL
jgi:hypothetical protein